MIYVEYVLSACLFLSCFTYLCLVRNDLINMFKQTYSFTWSPVVCMLPQTIQPYPYPFHICFIYAPIHPVIPLHFLIHVVCSGIHSVIPLLVLVNIVWSSFSQPYPFSLTSTCGCEHHSTSHTPSLFHRYYRYGPHSIKHAPSLSSICVYPFNYP